MLTFVIEIKILKSSITMRNRINFFPNNLSSCYNFLVYNKLEP